MKPSLREMWSVLCTCCVLGSMPVHAQTQVLDDFSDSRPWVADASDQVKAELRRETTATGTALCLDYDFNGVSGNAVARRPLALQFPENYRFDLVLHGTGGANNLELKWVDASGENVWWATRRQWTPPNRPEPWGIKKRHIEFAWGPAADKRLRQSAALELVVSSGSAGGRGSVCLDALRWSALPVPSVTTSEPLLQPQGPDEGFSGQWLVDLGASREWGAATLHWAKGQAPRRYELQTSEDGQQWETRWRPTQVAGDVHDWFLPESQGRFLRVRLREGQAKEHPLLKVELGDVALGASRNAFLQHLAPRLTAGALPRSFSGTQSYWTVLGAEGGGATALLGEDGAIELGLAGPSLEPFLWLDSGERVSWAQAKVQHSLLEGYLPIPTVQWRHGDLTLDVTAVAASEQAQTQVLARYVLRNHGRVAQKLRLVLALRPWQVNPPTQFLNTPGGTVPVQRIGWDGHVLQTDTRAQVWPLSRPDQVWLWPVEASWAVPWAAPMGTGAPVPHSVQDEQALAQGALVYQWVVPPQGQQRLDVVLPLMGAARLPGNPGATAAWADQQMSASAERWRALLNPLKLRVPAAGQLLVDSLRSALAHMLMSRDGAALRPGTRSYARSWIRDGAMMVEGLLRVGHDRAAQDFVQWFAPYQFASGKVPCCVDRRGADPVPENDSHGQLVFAVAQLHRYTRDATQLRQLWPHVERAVAYMETLRQSERSSQNLLGERRAFWGLMPASISHEGYSAKPMHSYWDDFWALRGYKDAVYLARQLGHKAQEQRWQAALEEFERDLQHSLTLTASRHGLDYLAGSAELGDFDATSTTVALSPAQARVDEKLLNGTFERYWREFVRRRDVDRQWEDYTPYELRTVSSMLRLGWSDRAHEALQFFLADQRPSGWNQWAEVVGREARKPRFVGDMPHAWISSDYVRAVLDMFAYEREADGAIVLGAGVPAQWLQGQGVGVSGLATSVGRISYSMQVLPWGLNIQMRAPRPPVGGWRFRWPGPSRPPAQVRVNGRLVAWQGQELSF